MKGRNDFDFISYLYCFIGMFFFSTTELAGKFAGEAISPVTITIVRFFIGSALLAPFALLLNKQQKQIISVKNVFIIGYPGIMNVAGAMLFLQFAIYYGKASTSAMLISSNPLFVAIFAALILEERLNLRKLLGIIVGLAGVFLVIKGDDPLTATASNPFLGIVFGVLASISFGLYTVLAKKQIAIYGNFFFNTLSFALGAVTLTVIALSLRLDLSFELTAKNISLLIYMGIFITGLAYIFFFAGLKKIPAANGSMMFFFKPIIASFLAIILLGERITIIQVFGIFLIIAGIYVTNAGRAKT